MERIPHPAPPDTPGPRSGSPANADDERVPVQRTDLAKGLSVAEAAKRLQQFGPNAIEENRTSPLLKFLSFFWGPIPWMIEVAGILSATVQRWEDFTIIAVMLLINAGVGFWEEFKADNAIAASRSTGCSTIRQETRGGISPG